MSDFPAAVRDHAPFGEDTLREGALQEPRDLIYNEPFRPERPERLVVRVSCDHAQVGYDAVGDKYTPRIFSAGGGDVRRLPGHFNNRKSMGPCSFYDFHIGSVMDGDRVRPPPPAAGVSL